MAMAIAQPDLSQAFSSPTLTPIEELLQSAALASTSLSRSSSMGPNGSSSSAASTSEDPSQSKNSEDSSMLARLLSHNDLFPMILGNLDIRSLLSLTSINARFRREILMPATPNLCCLNLFLQNRTVVCPMAQFENLKDFMVKYRSFKPYHLHFTYSEGSSLMSLVPEVAPPIYNSKQDMTFSHPSSSPLTNSDIYGVNQNISINVTSSNSLCQHHPPLSEQPHPQSPPQLQHTQHENDQPETTSSYASSNTSNTNLASTNYNNKINNDINGTTTTNNTMLAAINRMQTMRTCSSSSADSIISDNCESAGDRKSRKGEYQGHKCSDIADLDMRTAKMTMTPSIDIPKSSDAASTRQQQQQQQQLLQQQQQQQNHSSRFTNINRLSSSVGNSHNHALSSMSHHNGHNDVHSSSARSESIPVLSSSSTSISSPLSAHGHHGFELSYWQKFALNELFMRLLPFLRTLTVGRTDKPSRQARTRDSSRASGELSAGVCFFLARCFNVMHDMPDTALESVLWMDVTVRDVALLVTMIELRDIMVDGRYWKRGYWAADRPSSCEDMGEVDPHYEGHGRHFGGSDDDEDDWDGFYYLINQEGADNRTFPPSEKTLTSSAAGKMPQRKSSAMRSPASSSTFLKQTIASATTQRPMSGLGHLVKNSASGSSGPSSALTQPSSSIVDNTISGSSGADYTRYNKRAHAIAPPAAWQGFGDGVTELNAATTLFAEPELPPAVQLYETLKAEITEAASISRTLNKGKQTTASIPSDPWVKSK
ncbi:hypothetical protein BGZ54_007073 [Gamsiella multidivaricata]|nr:hypothetical protein BGZ54_007073 [Gamsiella multidivaricata]